MDKLFIIIIGLAGGSTVGSGLIAFITALGVVDRVVQIGKTAKFINLYAWIMVIGAVFSTLVYFLSFNLGLGYIATIIVGITMGIFVGMLASALTEVINVIPVFSRRIKMTKYIAIILLVISLAKTIGSLIYWTYPLIWN